MSTRDADRKRKRAYEEGLMPPAQAGRVMPDGTAIEAHEVELDAIGRIEDGTRSAWDVLAIEALAGKRFDAGCAIGDGDVDACPGWCAAAIRGFEGWVMAS